MFQVKNKAYFISELLVKEVFKKDDRYFVRLKTKEEYDLIIKYLQ